MRSKDDKNGLKQREDGDKETAGIMHFAKFAIKMSRRMKLQLGKVGSREGCALLLWFDF